ncbi:hypothetical protein LTR37_010265 [Vermiconidia calcicola]|uniref:Uncharacterized protein n=1 Tax=Vermiconidia calcicola TaxID=1690605 RepID=A0ACC3N583_9PEZI|nr:hypothetical protein LTR37_010265 [Vermiconidia calcicola]
MSKRTQDSQGGYERYGGPRDEESMADKPVNATAAQMARRKIAQARKPTSSQRSSRAGTPTANPFGQPQQQSMPSFQPPTQGGGTGFGGDFSFSAGASNPFAQQNGQNGTPPPTSFQFGGTSTQTPAQQNGGGGLFGNAGTSFGSTFGANASQPQQNGFNPSTSSIFSNQNNGNENKTTPSFSFGQTNQSQPQQNDLTPSTSASFPSFNKQDDSNPFKGFQSQQPTQSTPSTSFGGFGQNSQQTNGEKTPATPAFGGFGQNKDAQPKGNDTETPKTSTASIFSSFGQQPNGNKPMFGLNSQSQETPKANPSSVLGSQQQNGLPKGLFGSSPPLEQASSKPDGSVFLGLDSARASTIKAGMFTQSQSETPKPSSSNPFSFGQQNGAPAKEQETPKPSTLFSGSNQSQQTNGFNSNMFGGSTTNEQQTPKPASNPFAFGQQQNNNNASTFEFGQSQQNDTSMTTPGNTPQKQNQNASSETPAGQGRSRFERISRDEPPTTAQKSSFTPSSSSSLFNAPATSSTANNENQTPAVQGRSMFERVSRDEPSTTAQKQTSFTPSTGLFSQPAEQAANTPSAAPWISHTPASTAPATTITPPTPQPPTTARKTATATMSETISESERNTFKALNEGLTKHLAKQDPNVDWTTMMQYYLQQAATIRNKPEPKFDAPATVAPKTPAAGVSGSTSVFTSQQASAPAAGTTSPTKNTFGAQQSSAQQASSGSAAGNMFGSQQSSAPSASTHSTANMFGSATPKAPISNSSNMFGSATPKAPSSSSSNMFGGVSSQQTPKPTFSTQSNLSQPPATAPVSKKRPAIFLEDDEDEADKAPATEKRARANEPINYPKLPDNASETAKLFQAALDKSSASSQTAPASGFKPAPAGSNGSTPAPSSGFAPTGMPSFSAPAANSGGFLASFGKKANEQEEKEKKKRKAEDYDSDEETEEQWEKRDREEQEAKRQKLMEEAKSAKGFTLGGSLAADKQPETPTGAGKSMFERISKDPPATAPSKPNLFSQTPAAEKTTSFGFGSKTPAAPSTSNIFGSMSKASTSETPAAPSTSNIFGSMWEPSTSYANNAVNGDSEKDKQANDNTWKTNTPIKFGAGYTTGTESTTPAAPPPKFGNLFGPTSSAGSAGQLNVPGAKPTIGFNFGAQFASSAGTSRATTPGVTTDGEGASTAGEGDGDEDTTQNEPQAKDQTGLQDEESKHEDLLFTVRAKAMKYEDKKDAETGGTSKGWLEKGRGPLYLLKHRETGKVRVLLKIEPLGRLGMNFSVINSDYRTTGTNGTIVQGLFVDQIARTNETAPSRWMVFVKERASAEKIVEILDENKPKA